jgi:hypothetical protein
MDSLGQSCCIMSLRNSTMFPTSGMSFIIPRFPAVLLNPPGPVLTHDDPLYPSTTLCLLTRFPRTCTDDQCQGDHLRRLPHTPRTGSKQVLSRCKPRQRRRARLDRRRPNFLHHVPNLRRMVNNPRSFLRHPLIRNGRIFNRWTIPPRRCWSPKGHARSTTR